MRHSTLVFIAASLFGAAPAYALEFWHASTVWAGQGQCSAKFVFDGGGEDLHTLRVSVSAINRSGQKVVSGVLEIEQIGESSADRYAEAFLEGEEICEDGLTIIVDKATAVIEGKNVDLLKMRFLTARDFKPFKIRVSK